MKIIFFPLFILFISSIAQAVNIAVIDLEKLINDNKYFIKTIENIENHQKNEQEQLNKKENEIIALKEEIEESKVILDETQLNILINKYNEELNIFTNLINEYNLHYKNEIIELRKSVLKQIIVLVEKYVKSNKIDLVLDSTNYLIASNSIDITNFIALELNEIKINLDFKKFEKN